VALMSVVGMGLWMLATSAAWGNMVTPMCTTDLAGQTPCNAGWYTGPVLVSWVWTPISGSSPTPGCNAEQSFNGDTVKIVSCNVSWPSPPDISYPYSVHVEVSNPAATATATRPPDSNGWYNHPVAVAFGGSAFSGIASCTPAATYSGPSIQGGMVAGSCVDNAGKTAPAAVRLLYDATPPTISAPRSRPPDHHGWYSHPVRFSFTGTDALSGISGCSTVTYSGPDTATGSVIGTCRDQAGNVATMSVPLRYGGAPPPLRVAANTGDGAVSLQWRAGVALSSLVLSRSPGIGGAARSVVYRGSRASFRDTNVRNGVRYRYTLTAVDPAGIASVRTIFVTAGPHLIAPMVGARLNAPPLLSWTPVNGASYYNVQLFRAGKILSAWPTEVRLQLQRTWTFEGRRIRLKPGRYRWYVWPGFGSRSAARYGSLVGSGSFTVSRAT
jgi:hypothetical protein